MRVLNAAGNTVSDIAARARLPPDVLPDSRPVIRAEDVMARQIRIAAVKKGQRTRAAPTRAPSAISTRTAREVEFTATARAELRLRTATVR